jgi:excisionase family DNA binding protein
MDVHGTKNYAVGRSDLEPLLTVREVCDALAISRQTLYRLLERGDLVAIRVSESPRFRPSEIQNYLDQRKGVSDAMTVVATSTNSDSGSI